MGDHDLDLGENPFEHLAHGVDRAHPVVQEEDLSATPHLAQDLRPDGPPTILLSIHAGPWELLPRMLPRSAARTTVLYRPPRNRIAAALLITGAFHHDGLADIADAFGGGWTVEQRFEILKDSRLGTYGTSALTIAILIEVATVASFDAPTGFRAIIAAHALGRSAALVAMVLAPVAGDGLGASYTRELSTLRVVVGTAVGIAIAVWLSPVLFVWPLIAASIATCAVVLLAVRKIGGVTGDVLGAIAVCATIGSLVATAAAIS